MLSNLGKGKKETIALGVAIQEAKNSKELQKALSNMLNAMMEKKITPKQFETLHELFESRASELREMRRLNKEQKWEKANEAVSVVKSAGLSAFSHVKRMTDKLPKVKVNIEVTKKEDK